MNIKQHIEAGHYERDAQGRALLATRDGGTVTIVCTDMPGPRPLLGWIATPAICKAVSREWQANGICPLEDGNTLLPPPPRKTRIMATMCIPWRDGRRDHHRKPTIELGDITANAESNREWKYILLVGEYEEPV